MNGRMIVVSPQITLDEKEIQFDFIRASGPGGQNVNKVSTAVQLRFDIHASSLSEEVKNRLKELSGRRVTQSGFLIIEAKRYRSQEKNRQDAIQRLVGLIQKAAIPPKIRKRTKPSQASKQRRLENKKKRSKIKSLRKPPSSMDA